MDQRDLFYRNADPWTSVEAGNKASLGASRGRLLVLQALADHGPLTDFELADVTGWQQTSIGKRRLECARRGWVEPCLDDNGEQKTRPAPSGSKSLVWKLADKEIET